jgi:arylsulfatase A-like enzyme
VTYAYISDAHDAHPNGPAYGPGQAGYVAALKAYDQAFGDFFERLNHDGINQSNTLFVFTSDEGDHFVGGPPTPANCNGVEVPCTYNTIGEVNANLSGLLATEQGVTTPFKVHSDSAPNIYITGNPARDATVTRTFDQAVGKLTAVNPITGKTDTLTNYLADPVEMNLLHMITADPARTPTLTMFADPNYFLFAGAPNCSSPCVQVEPGFAWNHGDVSPDINTTWLGIVGPGVRHLGVDDAVWSDHTDIRPTMMMLLGLRDDYTHDGRALFEVVDRWALPTAAREHSETLLHLGQTYKQIDAAVGQLGLASLVISTRALESNSAGDATYTTLENDLASFTSQRDALVAQMNALLEGVAFHGKAINEQQAKSLIEQGNALLNAVNALAGGKSK